MDNLRDWLTTFGRIIVRPTPQTFLSEASKARGKFPGAVGWLVATAVFMSVATMIIVEYPFAPAMVLFSAIILPIAFLFFVFFLHLLPRRIFGKKQDNYEELLYLTVGIFVPLTLIGVPATWIPAVGPTVSNLLVLYCLGLTMIAVSAVTKIGALRALLVVALALVAAAAGFFCIAGMVLGLMRAVPGVLS